MQLQGFLTTELHKLKTADLYRSLKVFGTNLLNLASNNYLGLTGGAGASRLVTGNHRQYLELERLIADWKHSAAALVFPTGYMANLGVISALMGSGDLIIIDKLNHASIIDGVYLSGADLRVYKHKDPENLEKILKTAQSKYRKILIITETVFSMDGDLAPLKEIVELAQKHGAWSMVDEAHAAGVLGDTGAGLAEVLNLENKIDIKVGTLSKAIGALGGYVAGSKLLIEYLINKSRPFIYTTGLPPELVSAATRNLKKVISGHSLRKKLWNNINYFYQECIRCGLPVKQPESAIIPIIIGAEKKALALALALQKIGILCPAIRYPTVAKNTARLRCVISASHSRPQLKQAVTQIASCLKHNLRQETL